MSEVVTVACMMMPSTMSVPDELSGQGGAACFGFLFQRSINCVGHRG